MGSVCERTDSAGPRARPSRTAAPPAPRAVLSARGDLGHRAGRCSSRDARTRHVPHAPAARPASRRGSRGRRQPAWRGVRGTGLPAGDHRLERRCHAIVPRGSPRRLPAVAGATPVAVPRPHSARADNQDVGVPVERLGTEYGGETRLMRACPTYPPTGTPVRMRTQTCTLLFGRLEPPGCRIPEARAGCAPRGQPLVSALPTPFAPEGRASEPPREALPAKNPRRMTHSQGRPS